MNGQIAYRYSRARFSYWLSGALAASSLISACTTTRVGSDFDRNASFAGYHSYAWVPREHEQGRNPLAVRFARESIEAELDQKGFTLAKDPESADFDVDFTIGAHDRIDVSSYPTGYRGPWTWGRGYYGDQLNVRQYHEGTLAIDIFDGRTHQPVWTGWASKEISHADKARSEEPIRAAAAAVLAQFPPDSTVASAQP
jgi:hypothetical protein